jgi:hypothetical protein
MGYTRGAGIFVRMSVENKLSRQILKMTPMKTDSQNHESKIIQHGKSGGFILCVFRTGSPENSAKVGAVGDIHFVQ